MLYLKMSFIYKEAMSAFITAYTEYLERMYDESDDLVSVDVFTVPKDVDPESATLIEWADVS